MWLSTLPLKEEDTAYRARILGSREDTIWMVIITLTKYV